MISSPRIFISFSPTPLTPLSPELSASFFPPPHILACGGKYAALCSSYHKHTHICPKQKRGSSLFDDDDAAAAEVLVICSSFI